MHNEPESHPLIIISGWKIEQGQEQATITVQPPENTSGIIQIDWVSGQQPGMKVTWHTEDGASGAVNANRPNAPVNVQQGTAATLTGFNNGNPWGPADNPTLNGSSKADATFGPEGARMTISITVPSIGDGKPDNLN